MDELLLEQEQFYQQGQKSSVSVVRRVQPKVAAKKTIELIQKTPRMSGFDFQIKENIADTFTFEPPKAHRQAFPEVPLLPEESLRANGDPLTEHDLARKIPEDVKYGKQESVWEVPDHKRNDVLESYRFDLEGNVIGKLSNDMGNVEDICAIFIQTDVESILGDRQYFQCQFE
jgi:hypothetical protein